jgi:UDP-N-acetylmuramate--alanine ligase
MNVNIKADTFYFIGIGGIGMSALARYFKSHGKNVLGYDKTSTALTGELISEGIEIHYQDNVEFVESKFRNLKSQLLIIYTPAIPKIHNELNYFLNNGFTVLKRSEVLGLITKDKYTIAVAGTHGKTTTASMIAHILKSAGMKCTAFLGGIAKNYNSNFITGNSGSSEKLNELIVVEADEYDRSFLTLYPDIGVITSMDSDHLDVYGDKNHLEESYKLFAKQVKGTLIFKKGLPLEDIQFIRKQYSISKRSDYSASDIRIQNHQYYFNWHNSSSEIENLSSLMPGLHNVENAVVAIAVARNIGIGIQEISKAILTYEGVKRRFDYQLRTKGIVYIDDYAHHPVELRACILSVRELYPDKKITGIFQPHLFSRTRDFADGFAESLSLLDDLILLDIYPARELPIKEVSSKMILDKVTLQSKMLMSKEGVIDELKKRNPEVVLTLGAGDIDQLVEPIKRLLEQK